VRFVFALYVVHPFVVALLANAVYPHLRVVHPLGEGLSEFDVYRLEGIEIF
jgi:hypothetical protein